MNETSRGSSGFSMAWSDFWLPFWVMFCLLVGGVDFTLKLPFPHICKLIPTVSVITYAYRENFSHYRLTNVLSFVPTGPGQTTCLHVYTWTNHGSQGDGIKLIGLGNQGPFLEIGDESTPPNQWLRHKGTGWNGMDAGEEAKSFCHWRIQSIFSLLIHWTINFGSLLNANILCLRSRNRGMHRRYPLSMI